MKNNKGISLIVLVVTIIVIIILASSVIISLSSNNPILQASEAKFKSNASTYNSELVLAISNKYLEIPSYDTSGFNLTVWDGNLAFDHVSGTIKEYIPSITVEDGSKYSVKSGKLVYVGSDITEENWLLNIGIKSVLGINVIATENTTVNGDAASYNNPIVPKGFKAIEDGTVWPSDWEDGLVIQDEVGNQFVWVPVYGTTIPYEKWCTSSIAFNDASISDDSMPSGVTNEIDQITTFGGFYVARYEAGKDGSTLVSKKNATVWTDIDYIDSKIIAESMYNLDEVKSGLATGTQWDTIMKWVENSEKNVTNSTTWGNHGNSQPPADVSGYGSKQVAGYSEEWKANNIYDLAGNTWDWTNELYNTDRGIQRGGDYHTDGISYPAASRDTCPINVPNVCVSFRVALYIDDTDAGLGVGVIAKENTTINGAPASYDNPIIPKGFKAIEDGTVWPTGWNNGLVIQDTSGNQFVWVPVDGTNVKYEKWCITGTSYDQPNIADDNEPLGFNATNITTTYKGFYIARYESMFDYNGGSIRVASRKSKNKTDEGWTKNNSNSGILWNFISYTDSKTYAENMAASYGYDQTKIGTNLITGTQWDTTMKWIQNATISVTNSRAWGNYNNSTSPVAGFGSLQISGYSNYWKAKNIYDLAGNTWEWTNEKYSTSYVIRGGSYNYDGIVNPAADRGYYGASNENGNLTFRTALYIK